MGVYKLDKDLVLRLGEAQWAVQRILDDRYVQLENLSTGRIRKERISKLCDDIASGNLQVISGRASTAPICHADGRRVVFCADSLPERHRAAYIRANDYVRAMHKRGISLGQRKRIAEALAAVSEALRDSHPPKASTVMRWMRIYDRNDRDHLSLVPKTPLRKRSKVIGDDVRTVVAEVLRRYYFIRNGCTIKTAHDRVLQALERLTVEKKEHIATRSVISLSTVRRIALETPPFYRDRARLGTAEARAKWRLSKPGLIATRPLERVEMDHTPLDLYVIDDVHGIPLGRPTLTLMVCTYSAYITGFYISFEGESLARIVRTIKIAIQPKDAITSAAKLKNRWHAEGLWETLVVDNAAAYHSSKLKEIANDLGINVENCPVRMPWFKPVVERYIGEACRQLPPQGRPRPAGRNADPIDPNVTACVTFNDLCEGILRWVVDVHPFQIHCQKLSRPIDLFLEGLEKCPAPSFVDNYSSLNVIAGISREVTVRQNGVWLSYITYTNDALFELRNEVNVNFKTTVKFDPHDLGEIYVLHPKRKLWFRVQAKDQKYAAGLSQTQHKAIRAAAKEKLSVSNAERVLRESKLALQDFFAEKVLAGKKLRTSTKTYRQLRGHSSPSISHEEEMLPSGAFVDDHQEDVSAETPTFETFSLDDL
ncbi:transposase family protein [Caballeronia sp. ATUFL_F2_KS9A]|uniref:transposase family protein n=1 Tax=Caballeronia sp. ATUFL_F2_KS9A TaxID=2921777 RepID=UPI002028C8D4